MNLERYEFVSVKDSRYFEFLSVGPKGEIKKVVEFSRIDGPPDNLFNLAFGDWNETLQDIDDLIVSDNKDTDKILATIAVAVLHFFEQHPTALIYVEGSCAARTRLYQMQINKHWLSIEPVLCIFGLSKHGDFTVFRIIWPS